MPEQTATRQGPLSHIKVLDLSRIMAGPWSTQILADLGADVIKVERPGAGDDTRSWGPPFLKDKAGQPTREAGYYLSVNRGKRSITVDITTSEGQEVVRRLATTSDILVENYKVGTLVRYGLDYDSLKAINPKLIYASVTGFGQTGPRKNAAAYDFAIQAMGGLMSVTGERDDVPGGGPQKVGVPIVDLMTRYVCGRRRSGSACASRRDWPWRLHRHRNVGCSSGLLGKSGDELSGFWTRAEAQRKPPSKYPAAGRLPLCRRIHRSRGRKR